MPIIESGFTLNFPDNNYFRFQDCEGYRNIQENFKEMDICWYDQNSDILYIIELKDWGDGTLVEEQDPNFTVQMINEMKAGITKSRISVLFKKSIDSMCMFMSILLNKPYSVNIQNCSPFTITNDTTIKILSLINWTNQDNTYIAAINTAYRSYFQSYGTLFNIRYFLVMTKAQAVQAFPWIT